MWVAFANAPHIFFCKNISVYAIFDDQNLNDTLTNDIVSFEHWACLDHMNCQALCFLRIEKNKIMPSATISLGTLKVKTHWFAEIHTV